MYQLSLGSNSGPLLCRLSDGNRSDAPSDDDAWCLRSCADACVAYDNVDDPGGGDDGIAREKSTSSDDVEHVQLTGREHETDAIAPLRGTRETTTPSEPSESSSVSDSSESIDASPTKAALDEMVSDFYRNLDCGGTEAVSPLWRSIAANANSTRIPRHMHRPRRRERARAICIDDLKEAQPTECPETLVWKRLGGERSFERAFTKLGKRTSQVVSVAGGINDIVWCDAQWGWAASLLVSLVRAPSTDGVRLCVCVVYVHFIQHVEGDGDVGLHDERVSASFGCLPSALWSRRRVRSRFVLADELLFDHPRPTRWNRDDADDIVVSALRR
jgi:hypothetical protein